MSSKTYLIYGVSKGLGKALTQLLPSANDQMYGVSRTAPSHLKEQLNLIWIPADLSKPIEAVNEITAKIGEQKIDCLIYNVGIWEQTAFSEEYNFQEIKPEEILTMVNKNVSSCILAIQSLIENLKLSEKGKVIIIGSTWGLDNHNGKESSFLSYKVCSKSIVHALRGNLREHHIGVSVLNLGFLEDMSVKDDLLKSEKVESYGIPVQDVINAVKFILSTSNASCVKEINMPAMQDMNV
ncbi:short-chain dehydrogenase [Pedobacter sp. PACM 27299]|uniref:SDR family NAD(P)-dependent oxidoreductase n=1 Tax=Pedobacter sp. PACM 27299 TaxID=1727164 RepID=UPI000705AD32|nr:SDR family oxidoreductase [Pedobacter sp. PACM 27299]ALL06765.1 short-chain dehydrogenase [Pedobacter sp. PACM 27299]